jgi:hypothetical protein
MEPIEKLREKLCRELAQSEHDAETHCEREARRYGAQPPGQAMRAVSQHARSLRPRLATIFGDQQIGARAGRAVGEAFSAVRHFAADWMIDAERSYRGTLLGLRHGLDAARLLRSVLVEQRDRASIAICDELIAGRARLLERLERHLRWFAQHPAVALRSSRRRTVKSTPRLALDSDRKARRKRVT